MEDLTSGSISRHLLRTAGFMLVMMLVQTLYFLIDLYWVSRLGTSAVAGVGIAGNVSFLVLAVMQMLNVGTTTVISHATGRRDRQAAQRLFEQALVLAAVTGVVFLAVGFAACDAYVRAVSADADTARQARIYLLWFIPAMALQFPFGVMGAALRGTGSFKPGMVVSSATVILNMVMAPFLIFGWGTGRALGVAGAAISTLVSIVFGIVFLALYFTPRDAYLRLALDDWCPQLAECRRMLAIGAPIGFEYAMTTAYLVLVYAVSRPFGAAAQAGFGIGMRVVQAGFMPVVALGFAVAPVAGQNFGARLPDRVRRTFRDGAFLALAAMTVFALIAWRASASLVRPFSSDEQVISVGAQYLRIICWTFLASGVTFVSSSMFQALGNTMPSLIASGVRMIFVTALVLALRPLPRFALTWVWYVSLTAAALHLGLSLWFLRRELARRLEFGASVPSDILTPSLAPPRTAQRSS